MSSLIEYPPELLVKNIFKPYASNDFNTKHHVSETSNIDMDEAARSVGRILRKYKLLNLLGVCLIHNHFHLNDDEILLAKTVHEPKNYLHLKATRLTDAHIQPVPYMWAFDKDSTQLFALQYFDAVVNEEMKARFEALAKRSDDLKEFHDEFVILVKKMGMEDFLGVYLLYNDLLDDLKEGEDFVEATDEGAREQWITATREDKEKNAIITHWAFGDDGTPHMTGCYTKCYPGNNDNHYCRHIINMCQVH